MDWFTCSAIDARRDGSSRTLSCSGRDSRGKIKRAIPSSKSAINSFRDGARGASCWFAKLMAFIISSLLFGSPRRMVSINCSRSKEKWSFGSRSRIFAQCQHYQSTLSMINNDIKLIYIILRTEVVVLKSSKHVAMSGA